MKNLIAFKKGYITCDNNHQDNREDVAIFQHFLMGYGYMLTQDAFEQLSKADPIIIKRLGDELRGYFRTSIGEPKAKSLKQLVKTGELGEGVYTSVWSFCELIWGDSKDLSEVEEVYEYKKFKEIKYLSEDDFKKIFTSLVQINTALTPDDYKTVQWFVKEYGENLPMPDTIPFKENLCMVAALGIDVPVKTSTDVLRIATYMSNKTTNLIIPPKRIKVSSWSRDTMANPDYVKARFRKFSRAERRYLLNLINRVANPEEMVLRRGMWLRLGEILHPGDYMERFSIAYAAFHDLRNKKVRSWYGYVDAGFNKSFKEGLRRLSKRPGEFARRLDSLLRSAKNEEEETMVLTAFYDIGERISSKVLWELYTHFQKRTEVDNNRKIWIKGARKPTPLPTLSVLSEELVDAILAQIWLIFRDKFSKLESLGAVYIDEELKKIPLPTNMRTLSESTTVTVRGSRMPIEVEKDTLRAYIHWKAGVDLDLSMSFFNPSDKKYTVCSYTSINPHKTIKHSGDVIPGTRGNWAEYIDVVIDKVPYKYGLLTVRNYSGGSLESVDSTVGFMERDNPLSSKSWYPKTVTTSYKCKSKGSNVNLLIIDFEAREWILIDEDVAGIPVEFAGNILKYVESLAELPKVSVYDILKLHVEARGHQVTEIEEAEVVYNFDDFSTSYEKTAEFML